MKKVLLAASLLLASMSSAFAQVPDASGWKEGDEITEQVGLGNPNFTNEPADYWIFERGDQGNPTLTGGCFEMYDGVDVDLYQYVLLPAGMYKVEAQAYYRGGTSWDVDPNTYGTSDWKDNAVMYAQGGIYNLEDSTFIAERTFQTPIMPRLFDADEEKLYEDQDYTLNEDGSKSFTAGWDRSDNSTAYGFAPASIPGSLVYFAAGKYAPYNDGRGTKYNTVTFYIEEDGYVKIGISKMEALSADAVLATNFKLYYMGEAGEIAELIGLQEEVSALYNQVNDIVETSEGGMIYTLVSDALMEFEGEYGDISDMDKEQCITAKEFLSELLESAKAAQSAVKQLESVLPSMELLYNTTEYPGKAEFGVLLEAAKNCIDPSYEMGEDEGFETFVKAFDELIAGRFTYLMSQEKVNGAWDFSVVIANRFFTNEVNNPVWNAETNFWEYDQALKDAHPDFFNAMEFDSNNEAQKASRTELSGDVVLNSSDNTVPFKWYKTGSGGPGWEVYYDHKMTSCKSWAVTPTSGISLIGQYLTGLPNGYYSLTGMAEAWTNEGVDASDNHFVIRSATGSSRSERAEPRAWWNGNTKDSWNTLSTGMVEVTDGSVWVEASLNGFYSITGFQLFYYGETPDFTTLLAPTIAAARENAATLTWAGDIKAVDAILNSIPATIDSQEAYVAAVAAIDEANAYVAKATAAINELQNVITKFGDLYNAQAEGSPESLIAELAFMHNLSVGEDDPDATYLDAAVAAEDYAAYEDYLNYRKNMGELINDANIAPAIAEQNTYLTVNYADAAKLTAFKKSLAVPYNMAIFGQLGAADASEANPVNITSLLQNPSFEKPNGENDPSSGWKGVRIEEGTSISPSANEYARGHAEIWNASAFILSQKLSNLPAGTYELRVKAVYRDGYDVAVDRILAYREAGGEENWANHNAELFMKASDENDQFTYIKAIQSIGGTENSFTEVVTAYNTEEEEIDGEVVITKFPSKIQTLAPEGEGETMPDVTYEHKTEGSYPFDERREVDGEILYFPSSMYGFYSWCVNNPEAVTNKVQIEISRGESIELGIRKTKAIGGDWVIMDDFELFYLSGEKYKDDVVAIEDIAPAADEDAPIYNVAGQIVDKSYKGIVIKNGVKFINK